eukprot:83126_1
MPAIKQTKISRAFSARKKRKGCVQKSAIQDDTLTAKKCNLDNWVKSASTVKRGRTGSKKKTASKKPPKSSKKTRKSRQKTKKAASTPKNLTQLRIQAFTPKALDNDFASPSQKSTPINRPPSSKQRPAKSDPLSGPNKRLSFADDGTDPNLVAGASEKKKKKETSFGSVKSFAEDKSAKQTEIIAQTVTKSAPVEHQFEESKAGKPQNVEKVPEVFNPEEILIYTPSDANTPSETVPENPDNEPIVYIPSEPAGECVGTTPAKKSANISSANAGVPPNSRKATLSQSSVTNEGVSVTQTPVIESSPKNKSRVGHIATPAKKAPMSSLDILKASVSRPKLNHAATTAKSATPADNTDVLFGASRKLMAGKPRPFLSKSTRKKMAGVLGRSPVRTHAAGKYRPLLSNSTREKMVLALKTPSHSASKDAKPSTYLEWKQKRAQIDVLFKSPEKSVKSKTSNAALGATPSLSDQYSTPQRTANRTPRAGNYTPPKFPPESPYAKSDVGNAVAKKWENVNDETRPLPLPRSYELLIKKFNAAEVCMTMLLGRGEKHIPFDTLKRSTEMITKRQFFKIDLGRIKTVFPEGYKLDLMKIDGKGCEPDKQVVGVTLLDTGLAKSNRRKFMSSSLVHERKAEFVMRMRQRVLRCHKKFVEDNNLTFVRPETHNCYHADFSLEETPLPPPHKLPEPQKRTGSSVRALLSLGEGTQLEMARVQRELAKALGRNAVGVSKAVREAANRGSSLKSPESSQKPSLSEPGEDSVSIPVKPVRKELRGLSAKLLEKIRNRQAAKNILSNRKGERKEIAHLSGLDYLVGLIRQTCLFERRSRMPLGFLKLMLRKKSNKSTNIDTITAQLDMLRKIAPQWCETTGSRNDIFKIDMRVDLNDVRKLIAAELKKSRVSFDAE